MRLHLSWLTLACCLAACSSPVSGGQDGGALDSGITPPDAGGQVDAGGDAGTTPALSITAISPTHGPAGTAFTLQGTGFAAQAQVFFGAAAATNVAVNADGTRITGTVPPDQQNSLTVAVQVQNAPGVSATLPGAFTYDFFTIQSCKLDPPAMATVVVGQMTPLLHAEVNAPGIIPTEGDVSPLVGEVGFGDEMLPPDMWTWTSAFYVQQNNGNEVFTGGLTPGAAGTFRYAFRFTVDGSTYTYCDTTGTGFDATSAGTLAVLPKPTIASINPTHGQAGDLVTISGSGLIDGITVQFGMTPANIQSIAIDGTSAVVKVPAGSGSVPVSVSIGDVTDVLMGMFTYDLLPAWCQLDPPTKVTAFLGDASTPLSAEVYQPGVTPGSGRGPGLTAQIGFGDDMTPPAMWSWTDAAYSKDAGPNGNNDLFSATLQPAAVGTYRFAFRFSLDGQTFLYCDADGATNGFDPTQAGTLTVVAKPTLTGISPASGNPGDTVTVTGAGFTSSTTFAFGASPATNVTVAQDGSSATMTVPAGSGTVPVSAVVSGLSITSPSVQFTYARLPTWCTLDAPTSATIFLGDTSPAFVGEVYEPGVTTNTGAGMGVTAQVGYGLESAAPDTWTWTNATYSADGGVNNNNDLYSASLTPTAAGTFRYAYRFSIDGVDFLYCTTTGPSQPFDPTSAGTLTVLQKPAITSVQPSHAKVGDTVTVTGANLVAGTTFQFGGATAGNIALAADGTSATMTVPSGSGTVSVAAVFNGTATTWSGTFTYDGPQVTGLSPTFLPIAGGTLTITGANFNPATASVTIGGQAAPLMAGASSATQLVVTAPALGAGQQSVAITSDGVMVTAPSLPYVLKFTITPDGDLSDWPAAAKVASNSTVSDWAGNTLSDLYMGYDSTNVYIGIHGQAEAQNAIVGYLSLSNLSWGSGDIRQLSDSTGALDDMLSAGFNVVAPAFKAQYGIGLFGMAANITNTVDDGAGVRQLQDPTNFGWSKATVARTSTAVEFAIPWHTNASDVTDDFVAFPSGNGNPLTLQAFVRIDACNGTCFPNQSLPSDPNAVSSDPTVRYQVSSVSSIEVR